MLTSFRYKALNIAPRSGNALRTTDLFCIGTVRVLAQTDVCNIGPIFLNKIGISTVVTNHELRGSFYL
jgi:hypothetical protein